MPEPPPRRELRVSIPGPLHERIAKTAALNRLPVAAVVTALLLQGVRASEQAARRTDG